MNTTKIERIQKQIQKIKNKKENLILNLDETYKDILNYILKHKTYINHQNINNLLNKDNSLAKYIQVIESESDEDINTSQHYANMFINIKELSDKEISNQEIIDVDQKINDSQNQILYINNRKTKLNDQKKTLTTDYINVPTKLLQNLIVEKTNIFNVIDRIEQLEELNNNEFCNNFELIYLDNNKLQQEILTKKKRNRYTK